MTAASSGISVFAESPVIDFKIEGWNRGYNGWYYYDENHSGITGQDCEVDGILYSFDDKGLCTGKRSGMVKEDGVQRRYSEGLPYTGWTENKKDGSRKYYLDGYSVTGDHQIGKKIYSFDKNGIYTGRSRAPVLTARCDGVVSTDSDVIDLTVTGTDKEKCFGEPYIMERWENGKWVDAVSEGDSYSIYAVYHTLKKSEDGKKSVKFSPQSYTKNNFHEGYYRIAFQCWDEDNFEKTKENFYAVFEVVPPVEIKLSEEIYLYTRYSCKIEAEVTINSEKLKDKDYSLISYEPVYDDDGWLDWWDTDNFWWDAEPETEDCHKLYTYIDRSNMSGRCYKAVLEIDGTEYSKYFRIEKIRTDTDLSQENNDMIVTVDIENTYYKPIKIDTGTFELRNLESDDMSDARIADSKPAYKTLEPGEKITLRYDLTHFYDVSKFKDYFSNRYTFYIDGVGDVWFFWQNNEIDDYLKQQGGQKK